MMVIESQPLQPNPTNPRDWNKAQAQRGDAQCCQAGSQQLHHGTLELRPCTPTSHSRSQQHLIRFTATQQGRQNLTKRLSNSKLAMVGGIQLKMVSNCSFYLFDLDDETNDESDFGGETPNCLG